MKFDRLYYFKAIVETLSFTRGAEQYHIAQTAISRQITLLEQEVGCQLLQRKPHHVELTDAGKIFYEGIVEVLDKYEKTLAQTQEAAFSNTDTIKIGYGHFEQSFVAMLVEEYHNGNPNTRIVVVQRPYKDLINALLNRELDVIFTLPNCADSVKEEPVCFHELFANESCFYVNRKHPLSKKKAISCEDISKETIITTSEKEGPTSLQALNERMELNHYKPVKVISVNSLSAEILMLKANIGIAFGPLCIRHEMPPDICAVMGESEINPVEHFVAITRSDNRKKCLADFINGIDSSSTLWEWVNSIEKLRSELTR